MTSTIDDAAQALEYAAEKATERLRDLKEDLEHSVDYLAMEEGEAIIESYLRMDHELQVRKIKQIAADLHTLAYFVQEQLDRRLPGLFAAANIPKGHRRGKGFFPTTKLYVSAADGIGDEKLHDWLKANGYEAIVKETLNNNSLKAAIKEIKEQNGGKIPDDLEKLVKVTEVMSISVRKD